ncbi:MAG TPA: hypothetical protein VM692_07555 [Gammaproteobacteria bacterium]|nr:hypothetical protein [Gammaproteobacteria bacterium]
MSRVSLCLVLLTSSLAAGCAGSRATIAGAEATPTALPARETGSPDATAAALEPAKVVDGNQLAQRSADTLLCRDLLVFGSNMMRKTCGTAAQWKVYELREAEAAAETVRRMQQGRQVSSRRR